METQAQDYKWLLCPNCQSKLTRFIMPINIEIRCRHCGDVHKIYSDEGNKLCTEKVPKGQGNGYKPSNYK